MTAPVSKIRTGVTSQVRITIGPRDLSQIGVVSERFTRRLRSLLIDVPADVEVIVDIGLLPHVEPQVVDQLAACPAQRITVEAADWRMAAKYAQAIRDRRGGDSWW